MTAGIYRIRNLVNEHCYIGSAVNIRRRWTAHRHALRNHLKSPPKLQRAWDKYGEESFAFEVVRECDPAELLAMEQAHIDAEKPRYNTRSMAESNYGIRWSADVNKRKGRPKLVFTVQGVTGSILELVAHFGATTEKAARTRMERGVDVETAVTTPTKSKRESGVTSAAARKRAGITRAVPMQAFGVTAPLSELVARFSTLPVKSVRQRLLRGATLEAALTTPRRGW